jgi:hypothetical protein
MADETLTPSRLWKRMTPDQRLHAARAFWLEEQAGDEQAQAMMLIAQRKKFRAKTVLSLDVDRKASHLASLPGMPDVLAARTGDGELANIGEIYLEDNPDRGLQYFNKALASARETRNKSAEQFDRDAPRERRGASEVDPAKIGARNPEHDGPGV